MGNLELTGGAGATEAGGKGGTDPVGGLVDRGRGGAGGAIGGTAPVVGRPGSGVVVVTEAGAGGATGASNRVGGRLGSGVVVVTEGGAGGTGASVPVEGRPGRGVVVVTDMGGTVGTDPVGGLAESAAAILGGATGTGDVGERPGSGEVVAIDGIEEVGGLAAWTSDEVEGRVESGVVVVTGGRMTCGTGPVAPLGAEGAGKIERDSRLPCEGNGGGLGADVTAVGAGGGVDGLTSKG